MKQFKMQIQQQSKEKPSNTSVLGVDLKQRTLKVYDSCDPDKDKENKDL